MSRSVRCLGIQALPLSVEAGVPGVTHFCRVLAYRHAQRAGPCIVRPVAVAEGDLVALERDTQDRSSTEPICMPSQAKAASRTSSTVRRRISPVRVAQSMD